MTAENDTNEAPFGRDCPVRLYKYRGVAVASLSAIARDRLYFGDYTRFNDPFDCQASRRRSSTEGELPPTNKSENRLNLRVCCLSEVPDDLLMWGHYADSHQGFCLEITPANDPSMQRMCLPVTYQDEYPDPSVPIPGFADPTSAFMKVLLTKAMHWHYEKEWRLIMHVGKRAASSHGGEFRYKPKALTGIIYGMRMPKDHRMLLDRLTAHLPHLKKYEVLKHDSSYRLTISPIKAKHGID